MWAPIATCKVMPEAKMKIVGAIETGGTKTVCAVGSGPDNVLALERFPTTTPAETLERCLGLFETWQSEVEAVGIASFGPVDLDPSSPTWGYVTNTPKEEWQYVNLAGTFRERLGVPVLMDTDCNGAALGEYVWGAAQGLDTFIYLTIGTGIGGGGMVNGALMHGLLHPEMGHVFVPHDREQDPYPGWCMYHGDCLEGLAAGPALEGRWHMRGEEIPPDHPAWALEAQYLASGIVNFIYTLSPQMIILGGGVMDNSFLLDMVRDQIRAQMNGYLQVTRLLDELDQFVVPPALGNRAGVLGAMALGHLVLESPA